MADQASKPAQKLSGKAVSLWVETAPKKSYPKLTEDISVDVAVIGGGIAGLTTAHLLKKAGKKVAVLEASTIGSGVTGHTTGKVSSLHQLAYQQINSKHGENGARTYADANQAAVEEVAKIAEEEGIDCDLTRRDNFTFTEDLDKVKTIEKEAAVAEKIGLPAELTTETGLPFSVKAAIKVENQIEFHALKYLAGLAAVIDGDGSHVFEESRAIKYKSGNPSRVSTDISTVEAKDVVVATNVPVFDRGLFFARSHPHRSYLIAVKLNGPLPEGMYISTEPLHSIMPYQSGTTELLLIGGEGHKAGQGGDISERYRRLEEYARQKFDVKSVEYRWATQDGIPVDGVPYIGKMNPFTSHLWVATGFRKWGLSNGTVAGMILKDRILGRENAWAKLFDSTRIKPIASGSKYIKENLDAMVKLLKDRFGHEKITLQDLMEGQGKVASVNGKKVAVYRDDAGEIHAVSPVCTHLQCLVEFNNAERTWDCPCHGSRFTTDGEVIQGPARKPLEQQEVK